MACVMVVVVVVVVVVVAAAVAETYGEPRRVVGGVLEAEMCEQAGGLFGGWVGVGWGAWCFFFGCGVGFFPRQAW